MLLSLAFFVFRFILFSIFFRINQIIKKFSFLILAVTAFSLRLLCFIKHIISKFNKPVHFICFHIYSGKVLEGSIAFERKKKKVISAAKSWDILQSRSFLQNFSIYFASIWWYDLKWYNNLMIKVKKIGVNAISYNYRQQCCVNQHGNDIVNVKNRNEVWHHSHKRIIMKEQNKSDVISISRKLYWKVALVNRFPGKILWVFKIKLRLENWKSIYGIFIYVDL